MVSKDIDCIKIENKMEILGTELSEENPFGESKETSLAPSEGKVVPEDESDGLASQSGDEHGHKCDPELLKALSKRESRDKVIEIENIVRTFVIMSETDELMFPPDLTKSTYDRLLAHRISQHHGLHTSVRNSDCIIVATRRQGEQRASLVLKDIEVELEQREEEEGWQQHGRRRRQPGRVLMPKEKYVQHPAKQDGDSRGKSKYSSGSKHGEYENAKARIFNGGREQYQHQQIQHRQIQQQQIQQQQIQQQQTMMPSAGFPVYHTTYVDQEGVGMHPVKAQMRNHHKDCFDPDFHRHNGHMQHGMFNSNVGVYQQVPVDLMQPMYAQMAQHGQMAPVVMHTVPFPVSQVAYPQYGGYTIVPTTPPDFMTYDQGHMYGDGTAQYVNGMAPHTVQQGQRPTTNPQRPYPRSRGQ